MKLTNRRTAVLALLSRLSTPAAFELDRRSLPDQSQKFVLRHPRANLRTVEQIGGKVAFVLVQLDYALLDAVLDHKAVDRHRAALADAVRAVRRLVFHSGFHHGSRWIT